MLVLAIHASGNGIAMALVDLGNTDKKASYVRVMERGQAKVIHTGLQVMFDQLHIEPRELSGLVVTQGPGSFTGIRAGLATAHGFSLALHIPVQAIDSFTANVPPTIKGPVWVALDTQRKDLFVCRWQFGALQDGHTMSIDAFIAKHGEEPLPIYGDSEIAIAAQDQKMLDPVSLALRFNPQNASQSLTPIYARAPQIG